LLAFLIAGLPYCWPSFVTSASWFGAGEALSRRSLWHSTLSRTRGLVAAAVLGGGAVLPGEVHRHPDPVRGLRVEHEVQLVVVERAVLVAEAVVPELLLELEIGVASARESRETQARNAAQAYHGQGFGPFGWRLPGVPRSKACD
jgi:hypothetical protein